VNPECEFYNEVDDDFVDWYKDYEPLFGLIIMVIIALPLINIYFWILVNSLRKQIVGYQRAIMPMGNYNGQMAMNGVQGVQMYPMAVNQPMYPQGGINQPQYDPAMYPAQYVGPPIVQY
jgi:hypothetical protein